MAKQFGSELKVGKAKHASEKKSGNSFENSVYIEGVRILQKQERISYFFTLALSLALVMLMFVILRLV